MIVALWFIVFIISIPLETSAQLTYKVNLETGLFFNSDQSIYSETNNIFKVLGNLKYKFKRDNSEASLSLKIRPKIFNNDFHSIKYGARGNYIIYNKNITWKSILSYQYFKYLYTSNNSYFSSFSLITGAEFSITNSIPAQIFLGYSYQGIDFSNKTYSDFIYLDTKIKKSLSNYFNLSYGVFIENFSTESEIERSNKKHKAKGWYFGPQIGAKYLREFLFNLEYKFLILNSTNSLYPSYEHRINVLGGLLLSKKISFFLLVDFYFRRTQLKDTDNDSVLFLPTKNENHISIKLSYKMLKKVSVYTKIGYYRENLLSNNNKLEGMNVLLGIELKN